MTHALLAARELEVGYGDRLVLRGVSIEFAPGGVTALVGPNGSGKSTLLKALARLARPRSGATLLDGRDIHAVAGREVARRLAILSQDSVAPEALTVRGLVEQGRYPHRRFWRGPGPDDDAAVDRALELTGLADLAPRDLDTLSGGERQRAWIALALAQATPLLLLDEPTTYLDVAHQFEVLGLLRRLNREHGLTVVAVLHDLNQAARFADRMIALKDGAVVADGAPRAVLTAETLRDVFGLEATIAVDPVSGAPAFFHGKREG